MPNVYILAGGLNGWLDVFAGSDIHPVAYAVTDDQARFVFTTAIGSGYSASSPDPEEYELEYTSKVKLAKQAARRQAAAADDYPGARGERVAREAARHRDRRRFGLWEDDHLGGCGSRSR
ncbi:MAG: hypothetical protein WAM81_02210, partial [Acidimicrobiia bacterium]